ncbi:hypothetical protein CHS0354_028607 [Potamilus streckersoni]|uniref:Uncharacterized protein n=1 Tax=Potamilus streckersoni TaxID=2493646 RepID=A0AAE0VPX4_9BIVA|nr:hypothetical protein CHS0354_028607 [Potamilus streckersoni]
MEKVYMNQDHSSELLVKMAELWREDKFCDAFLHLRERTYKVHKLVLIAACPEVLAVLKHKEESKHTEFNFPDGFDTEAVEYVLKYLYDGVIHLRIDNVCKVEKLARHLHLNSLIKYCMEFRALLLGEGKLIVNQGELRHLHHSERPRHVFHKGAVKNDDKCSQIVCKISSMHGLQTNQDRSHVSSPNTITFNPVDLKAEPKSDSELDRQYTSLKRKNSIETKMDVVHDQKWQYGMETNPVYQALFSFSGYPWINMQSTADRLGTVISDGRQAEMDKYEQWAIKVPLKDQKFLQECSVCKKIFKDANRLKRHFRSHSEGTEVPVGVSFEIEKGNMEKCEKGEEHVVEDTLEDSNTDVGDSLEDSNESMVYDQNSTVIEDNAETMKVKESESRNRQSPDIVIRLYDAFLESESRNRQSPDIVLPLYDTVIRSQNQETGRALN